VYTCATPVTTDLDPFSDTFLDEPYAPLRQLRDTGPVVWLEPYRVYAMALSGSRTARSGRGRPA
jgi:hypothetical protein